MRQIRSLAMIVVLLLLLSHQAWATIPAEQKNRVLILNSYHLSYSWSDAEMTGILTTLKRERPAIEPMIEYLDCKYFPGMEHFPQLAALFAHKFKNVKIPVVIAADNPALEFALKYRAELFPEAAVVFCGINGYRPDLITGATNITGVAEVLDSRGTVELMLRLHPGTKEIFIIHDYTSTGLATRRETEAQLAPLADRVAFHYMENLSTSQMLDEIARLPANALVLALSYSRDSEGRVFNHPQIARLLSEKAKVPVYAAHEERLGAGIVGGSLLGGRLHGAKAAELALKILDGTPAATLPVITDISEARPMFDYKQLQRFGINVDRLPDTAVVINQPESFYRKYTLIVWVTIWIMVALLTVIGLLMYVARIRKQAATALAEKAAELEVRVAERTAELVAANKELDAFAYSVSHDLRAPLRGIDGFSLALLEEYGAQLDAEAKGYLQRIRNACVRMGHLIDDLLHLSRITRSQVVRKQLDLGAMVTEVVAELRQGDPQRSVEVSVPPTLKVTADPKLLHAVIDNLLGNAWKFTAKRAAAQISVGMLHQDGERVYFVRDNGAGFDMRYVDKLFGVFQRLHSTEEFAGTGIGLATAKRVIALHGGRIWAEGKVDEGATFYFTLGAQNYADHEGKNDPAGGR